MEHFLDELAPGQPYHELIPPSVVEQMKTYHWPGNVRELRNFVHAILALGEVPRVESAAPTEQEQVGFLSLPTQKLLHMGYNDARERVLHDFQETYLRALLERSGANLTQAAKSAQMNRTHLIELLKRHNLR